MTLSIIQHIALPENGTPPATPTLERAALREPTDGVKGKELKDMRQAEQLVEEVLCIADELASRQDLKPCSRVNKLFGRLVSTCIKPWNNAVVERVLGDREIEGVIGHLREMCAEGEGELEKYWAERFLEELEEKETKSDTSVQDPARISAAQTLLTQFPYHKNYIDLVNLELSNILAALSQQQQTISTSSTSPAEPITTSSPLSIAFIGSGPLPFTSFLFASSLPNAKITNIDLDSHAIHLSSKLARHLGYTTPETSHANPEKMTFLTSDATTISSLSSHNIVFLAALVGLNVPQKISIMKAVVSRMRPGALLVTRSAVGLRGLLYPVLEFEELEQGGVGVEMVVEVRPWNWIVNSTLVLRVL
ncbi:Nicotianamine synthase [Venturia nashicola]|nr:Nicotianamine synthase [Venturia nashicola]